MNKSLNKYKKSQWIKIRLSKRYKSRIAYKKISAGLITAQSVAMIKAIQSCASSDKFGKAFAITNVMIDHVKSVTESLKGQAKQ